jgi:hypothetical protein
MILYWFRNLVHYFPPWRRKLSRLNVSIICEGTAVAQRSLVNRSGIWDGINRCNLFCSCSRFEYKTAFNLVKIHLLFRIIPLIQWSVMFCRPYFIRFWGTEIYTPSVFRIYADIQGWRTNENMCNKLNS